MAINDEVARAFGSHTLWKARIERAAEAGKSEFRAEDVARNDLCTFGKWLHAADLAPAVRHSRHFAEVSRLHDEFHQAASAAIGKALSGDRAGARRELESGVYRSAAERFFDSLFAWQGDAATGLDDVAPMPRTLRRLAGGLTTRLWAALAVPLVLLTLAALGWAPPAVLIGGAVAGLTLGWLAIGSATARLTALIAATRALAKGDVNVTLPGMARVDSVGELARAVLVFKEQAIAVERIAGVRERDREKSESERRSALLQMAENIEGQTASTIGAIARDSESLYETAKRMAKGAQDVEENAQMVAAAAEQSLINAESVATATATLSDQIRQVARQMERSHEVVIDAVGAADNASATVDSLGQAMTAIDQVVQLIAEIAGQTNLLALNATIEAARAGDAGKGFAVVANEVKNLANQTARQTDEISARIAHLNAMAQKVIEAIRGTVQRVQDVEQIASAVAISVQEQHQATDRISHNVQQSSRAAREVADRIVTVADEAVQTGRRAGEVETKLRGMTEQVGALGRMLTRTVRTSTPEVNRRVAPRLPIDAPAQLAADHGRASVRLSDISTGGARISGPVPLGTGQRALLRLGDIDVAVEVIESRSEFCRLKFADGKGALVEGWMARQRPPAAVNS